MEIKICSRCEQSKSRSEFHLDARRVDGLYPYCKDCRRAYSGATKKAPRKFETKSEYDKDYRARMDAAEATARSRRRYLWATYRITPEEYAQMLRDQGGVCAICGKIPEDSVSSSKYGNRANLHVDHDHSCCPGKLSCGSCVRGVLCMRCNAGLGSFEDSLDLLKKAAEYLGRSK